MENRFDIPEKGERTPVAFRDDLREPEIQFGRCSVTGEWGKVVAVDMGDIAIECPVTDSGVEVDPITGEITFTKWKPAVFSSQATFSQEGLRLLQEWMQGRASPIPKIEPVLVYKWVVTYLDGSVLCQYITDAVGNEIEINSREIQWDKGVSQISIIPRFTDEGSLPSFTFVTATGAFFKNGEQIDVDYAGTYPEDAQLVYARKVTHTFGSVVGTQLARTLQSAHTTVLQLLGWHLDGVSGLETGNQRPCCVIAVDDRGNWRPWKQQI